MLVLQSKIEKNLRRILVPTLPVSLGILSMNSIKFIRQIFTDNSTIGDVLVDGIHKCFYLEPTCRKIPDKKMAIPAGHYEVVMYASPRFGNMNPRPAWLTLFDLRVPLLIGIPGHTGVEIHPGNTPADTIDCLCPGYSESVDFVGESDDAWRDLTQVIVNRLTSGQVYVDVIGGVV